MYTTTYQHDYSRGHFPAAPAQTASYMPQDSTVVSPAAIQVEFVKHDTVPPLQGSSAGSTVAPISSSATGVILPTSQQKVIAPQAQAPAGPGNMLYPHAMPPVASEPSTTGLLDPNIKDSGPSVVGSKAFCARPCLPALTGGLLGNHHHGRRQEDKQKASEQDALNSSIVRVQQGMTDDEALAAALANEEADQVSALRGQHRYKEQQQRWEQGLKAGPPGSSNSYSEHCQATDAAIAAAMHQADVEEAAAAANLMYPPIIAAESRDVLLSGRLSRLPSVRLVPRVNSAAIPLQPHVSPDRARLLKRLEQYGLVEREVKGDGACQFRSLSDQLYGSPAHHDAVRSAVVQELQVHPERYQAFVPTPYPQYLSEMSRPHSWGDHVTLQAAADAYGVRIVLITSFEDNSVLAIEPQTGYKTKRFLWLSFYAEVHYNSVYPREEPPGPIDEPPKLLGSRKLARILGQ